MTLQEYVANWRALPYQLWKATDRWLGTLFAPLFGDYPWSGETISSRSWRLAEAGIRRGKINVFVINNTLGRLLGQNNHCRGAFSKEATQADLPFEYKAKRE